MERDGRTIVAESSTKAKRSGRVIFVMITSDQNLWKEDSPCFASSASSSPPSVNLLLGLIRRKTHRFGGIETDPDVHLLFKNKEKFFVDQETRFSVPK